jgi:hypothetical protein
MAEDMKEPSKMAKRMEKARFNGLMGINILEAGKTVNSME